MAIEKTSATRLRKDELPYTTLPSKTAASIKNTDALAIWTYLQTKPEGWVVRASDIQRHFDIGRDKYRNAMKHLEGMGLVSYAKVQDDRGRLAGTDIHIHYEPTEGLKTRRSEKPTVGESAPLVMEGGVSNGSNSSYGASGDAPEPEGEAKAKRKTAFPEGFAPNETCRSKAIQLGISLELELEKFQDFHQAKGNKYVDWQAAFRNWLTKAAEFRARRGGNVADIYEHRQRSDVEVKRGPVRGRPIPYGSTQPDDDGILTLPDGTRCHVDDWDAGTVTWEDQA